MTVDEALEWAAKNCGEEAAQRLRSRAAAKALSDEVLNLCADRALENLKATGRLQQLEERRALAEQLKWGW